MATLYVENIPDDLYAALRKQAKLRRKSIAQEVISLLEAHVSTPQELERRRQFLQKALRMSARRAAGIRALSVHRRDAARGSRPLNLLRSRRERGCQVVPASRRRAPGGRSPGTAPRGMPKGMIELTVPDLFWAEFGNILWKAVRTGRLSEKSATEALTGHSALQPPHRERTRTG